MNKCFEKNKETANKIIKDFLLHKEKTAKDLVPEVFFVISEIRKNIFRKEFDIIAPKIEKFFLQMDLRFDKGCPFFVAAARMANFFLQDQGYGSKKSEEFTDILKKYQKKHDPRHICNSQLLILSDIISGFIYDIIMSSTLVDREKIAVCEQIAVFLEKCHLEKIKRLALLKI